MFKSLDNAAGQSTDQTGEKYISVRILQVITEELGFSQNQIANKLGEQLSTIKYHMGIMKQSGKIDRKGNNRNGEWIICKERKK